MVLEFLKEEFGTKTFFKTFEKSVSLSNVVLFNKNYIEFLDMIIFVRESKGKFLQVMNAGTDIFSVESESFDEMLNVLNNVFSKTIYLKSNTLPISSILINLSNIKDTLIFYKESKDMILCNNLLFTTSKLEFQGSGMFTEKKAFLVTEEEFLNIKNFLKVEGE